MLRSLCRLLPALVLLSVACGDKDDDDDDDDDDDGDDTGWVDDTGGGGDDTGTGTGDGSDIRVTPAGYDFGRVDVGDTASLDLLVENVGTGPLELLSHELAGDGASFALGSASSSVVEPGASVVLPVAFHPAVPGELSDTLMLTSNDPDEPQLEVALTGTGVGPAIEVTPSTTDFGTLYVGCDASQAVTIANVGNADLVVDSFEFDTASTELAFLDRSDIHGALPWSLAPGASYEVLVSYAPLDEYSDQSYLFVNSSDSAQPQAVTSQEGSAELYGSTVDVFEQAGSDQADIIFAVDRSCSMYDDVTYLQNSIGDLATALDAAGLDYQIAATVEDSGCINGSDLFIDNTFSSSDAQSTMSTMLNLGGSYGSNTERAFTLMESALAETVSSSGCNSGLVRPDASLHLVGMSDEPEQSTSSYTYYVPLFQSLKADPSDVVVHGIGGDHPSGCGTADAYTGIYEATVSTGGSFHSICSTDWAALMGDLAAGVSGSGGSQSTFELSSSPVPETITVQVDSVSTITGWAYDAGSNAVDFDSDHVPSLGSTIEIAYALLGDCDAR